MAGLQLPYGIDPVNPVFIDARMGPFSGSNENTAKNAALAAIPNGVRVKGLQIILYIDGNTKLYWFKNGILDSDLTELRAEEVRTYVVATKAEAQSFGETLNVYAKILVENDETNDGALVEYIWDKTKLLEYLLL